MTRLRIALAGTVAAMAATVLLLGGVLNESEQAEAGGAAAAATPDQFVAQFAPGDTNAVVRDLQQRLRTRPDDVESSVLLGLAYQQRVRETADFSDLTRSEGILERARELDPANADAIGGLATLALARHDFGRALTLGRKARRLAPSTARHYGVVGDALLELGRYREAFASFDRMVRLKPNVASYARVSYARELLGDKPGAIKAMQFALDAAAGRREALAWTHLQLGKIYLGMGRLQPAEAQFLAALEVFPTYLYGFEARAQLALAAGRNREAVAFGVRAADAVPLPQFVVSLADIYRASGNRPAAREQYALMDVIQRLLRANGVNSDLELALFRIDHGIRLREGLQLARAARVDRPSIFGDDVLAWALARNGRCDEARVYSKRSLRLGTKDASMYFHRGMIERCLGRKAEAARWFTRALETNPHFSPFWADVARRYSS